MDGVEAAQEELVTFALATVLHDQTLARSFSDELLTRVQKTFAKDRMIEKTLALYAR
mgnify:CR=1 FL=1